MVRVWLTGMVVTFAATSKRGFEKTNSVRLNPLSGHPLAAEISHTPQEVLFYKCPLSLLRRQHPLMPWTTF